MHKLGKLFKNQYGQAMVEMALILPILLMLCVGIMEFGRIMGSSMVINNLARDGARYGVVGHTNTEIRNKISSEHAWLDETQMRVTITPADGSRIAGNTLVVDVDYTVPLMTTFFANIVNLDTVSLSASCSMRIE